MCPLRSPRTGLIGWLFTAAVVLAVVSLAAVDRDAGGARVILWGDSLAWESQDAFAAALRGGGVDDVRIRTWGGTAVCDWMDDIRDQSRRWKPTTAVLSFSGNAATECIRGRNLIDAYRQDTVEAVDVLHRRGIDVVLVDAPAREDQDVGADGLTALNRVWRQIASGHPEVRVAPAALAVTQDGHFTRTLPCLPGEMCEPGGIVTVRSPDGVHFCPVAQPPMTACPVMAPGAVRFGKETARLVRDGLVQNGFVLNGVERGVVGLDVSPAHM